MRLTRLTIATGPLLATICSIATAHEFWIEPETHRPLAGKVFRVALHHGERFAGEVVPRDERKIRRFVALPGPGAESGADTPVVGRSGGPHSLARVVAPGPHIIVYESCDQTSVLPADRFEAYLREEGLDAIIRQRAQRGESDRPGRETYTRCAKSLVLSSPAGAAGDCDACDRAVGLPLEIIAGRVPHTVAERGSSPSQPLLLEVRYAGQPLPDAELVAVNRADPARLLRVTTDAKGQAAIPLPSAGRWMITTIHMVRVEPHAASDEQRPAAPGDWHSYWASLAFEISAPHDGGAPSPGATHSK